MIQIDPGAIAIFVIVIAVNAGISWQRILSLLDRVKELEKGHTHTIHTVNNVPTKEQMDKLYEDVQEMKLGIVKLQTILEYRKENFNNHDQK